MKGLAFLGGLPAGLAANGSADVLQLLGSPLLGGLNLAGAFGGKGKGGGAAQTFGSGETGTTLPPISAASQGPLATPQVDMPARIDGPAVPERGGGILGGIKDFMGSDDGKAALFRAGATMLGGGSLGDGMMAGANFMDGRKQMRKMDERDARDFDLRERGVDLQETTADRNWQLGQRGADQRDRALDQGELDSNRSYGLNLGRFGLESDRFNWQKDTDLRNFDYEKAQDAVRNSQWERSFAARRAGGGGGGGGSAGPLASKPIGSFTMKTPEQEAVEGNDRNWLMNLIGFEDTPAQPYKPGSSTKLNLYQMETDASRMVPGRYYQTQNGPAMWDGTQFVQQ